MSPYEKCMRALVWQATHVVRLAATNADEVRVKRKQYASRLQLAELRDQLAKMDLRRREIESWLEDFDDDLEDDEALQ